MVGTNWGVVAMVTLVIGNTCGGVGVVQSGERRGREVRLATVPCDADPGEERTGETSGNASELPILMRRNGGGRTAVRGS